MIFRDYDAYWRRHGVPGHASGKLRCAACMPRPSRAAAAAERGKRVTNSDHGTLYQFLGRACSIHCPADMLRTPATAVHDLLGGCWTCSIFACGSVLSICNSCLKRLHASRLSVISQDLTAAPCCPAAQGGGSHHSSGRARSSACAAAASAAGCEGTSCNCGTSQLIMQPISFTPFAVPCTIAKQCALPAAS